MTLDGGGTDAQSECYLLISLCSTNQSQHFLFRRRQPRAKVCQGHFVPFRFHHQTNHTCAAIFSIALFRRIFVKFFCSLQAKFRSLFLFQIEINVQNISDRVLLMSIRSWLRFLGVFKRRKTAFAMRPPPTGWQLLMTMVMPTDVRHIDSERRNC